MTETGLQAVVSTNVKVLMALHRIEAQKDLAAKLGWGESKLTKSLRGDRKWSLEDLPELATVFGVSPGALISGVDQLVGAAHPVRTGTDSVTRGVTSQYLPGNRGNVIELSQVRTARAGYHEISRGEYRRQAAPRAHRRDRHPDAKAAV